MARPVLSSEQIVEMIPERYQLLEFLSSGSFGQVVKCLNKDTDEAVAVKLPYHNQDCRFEVRLLRQMMRKRFDKCHIVRYFETFRTPLGQAMVFEILDTSLGHYIFEHPPMLISEVRPVIIQLATALEALRSMGVIHCDLKLDNVMVVNPTCSPLQIKVIDFGMALRREEAWTGMKVAVASHRAPEIILGLPFSEAIDMWAVAVIISTLVLRFCIFPCRTAFETLKVMIHLFGQPPDYFLNKAPMTEVLFRRVGKSWELLTDKEVLSDCDIETMQPYYSEYFSSLEDIMEANGVLKGPEEKEEKDFFLNLMSQMFEIVEEDRITPAQILQHPFVLYGQPGVETRPQTGVSDVLEEDVQQVNISLEEPLTATELKDVIPENYSLVRMLEVGEFGQEFLCKNEQVEEEVTVKLPFSSHASEKEACVMRKIMKQGLDKKNIIKFYESIEIEFGTALVFETMDMCLRYYMDEHYPLPLSEVQSITQQTATALVALKSINIIHADVNMDTIMLCKQTSQHPQQHPQVKLTNFALAFTRKKASPGMIVQKVAYRAPEVILGLPISEAIDVWSLGAVLANIILGLNMFPKKDEFETLKIIHKLFGVPADATLDVGIRTHRFFSIMGDSWALMTNKEYEKFLGLPSGTIQSHYFETFRSFADMLQANVFALGAYKEEELSSCVHLMLQMLKVDQTHRITPALILRHPFIYQPETCPGSEESQSESESEAEEDCCLETRTPRIIHVQPASPENTIILEGETEGNDREQSAATPEAATADTTETPPATISTRPFCLTDSTKKEKKKKTIVRRIFSWVRKRLSCISPRVKDE